MAVGRSCVPPSIECQCILSLRHLSNANASALDRTVNSVVKYRSDVLKRVPLSDTNNSHCQQSTRLSRTRLDVLNQHGAAPALHSFDHESGLDRCDQIGLIDAWRKLANAVATREPVRQKIILSSDVQHLNSSILFSKIYLEDVWSQASVHVEQCHRFRSTGVYIQWFVFCTCMHAMRWVLGRSM